MAWARRFCEGDARSRSAGEDLDFHVFETFDGGWVGRIDVHGIDLAAARGETAHVADQRRDGRDRPGAWCDRVACAMLRGEAAAHGLGDGNRPPAARQKVINISTRSGCIGR